MSPITRPSARGRSSSTATVGKNHPAAAAARHRRPPLQRDGTTPCRTSPSRKAKTLANAKIDDCFPSPRPPVATEAPHNAELTPGVTVGNVAPELPNNPIPPPLWNAWWCQTCTSLHLVGDGGALIGECIKCQVRDPIRNHVMLDPDEIEQVKKTPGLAYNPPSSGNRVSIPQPFASDVTTPLDIDTFSEESSAGDLVGDLLFPSGGDNASKVR